MGLCVDVVVRWPNERFDVLDVPEGCQDSAGFESWRWTVRGSEVVRSLGARHLPLPAAGGRLEVPAEELPLFLAEIALLRTHMDVICATLAPHAPRIVSRLDTIEAATLRARKIGARVLVR